MTEYKVHRARFVDFIPEAVNCLAFEDCSSNPRLAVSRQDGTIEIWSQTGLWTVDFVIPSQLGRSIESLTWCNHKLFSAGLEGEITEWDLEKLKEKHVVDSNGGPVWSLVANHKRNVLAAGCEDGAVRLFNIEFDELELLHVLDKQEFRVLSLAWSHDDANIVTGSTDSTIRLYDTKSKRIVSRISTDRLRDRSTLIWSIHLTKDMTIITGNSLGQTQFWDANVGTLLQGFKSHEADVLAICVNAKEDTIYSSGVDSRIVEFKFIQNKEDSEWMLAKGVKAVSHDIRALAISNDQKNLVAGGIDPRLIEFTSGQFDKNCFTLLSPFPQKPVCHLARNGNMLLFHEKNVVHLWKLPDVKETNMPDVAPKKLLQLKSSRDHHITSCDISSDGSILVFADIQGLTAFHVSSTYTDSQAPVFELSKIKLPQNDLTGIQQVKIIADNSKIILANYNGIGYLNLDDDDKLVSYFSNKPVDCKGPWTLLAVNSEGDHIAAVDSDSNIYLYSLELNKCILTLPKSQYKPMAIAFQPGTDNLVHVSVEKTLHVYNYKTEKIDQWSVKLNESKWLKRLPKKSSKFVNIVFNPQNAQEMFLQSEDGFLKIIIDTEKAFPEEIVNKKRKRKHPEVDSRIVKTCHEYSSLLYFDVTGDNALVVVERPLEEILTALPPALKLKKYGA